MAANERSVDFAKAMLAAKLAHIDGDDDLCQQFLGYAALWAETAEQHDRLADFVKQHNL